MTLIFTGIIKVSFLVLAIPIGIQNKNYDYQNKKLNSVYTLCTWLPKISVFLIRNHRVAKKPWKLK